MVQPAVAWCRPPLPTTTLPPGCCAFCRHCAHPDHRCQRHGQALGGPRRAVRPRIAAVRCAGCWLLGRCRRCSRHAAQAPLHTCMCSYQGGRKSRLPSLHLQARHTACLLSTRAGSQPEAGERRFVFEQSSEPFSFSVTRLDPPATPGNASRPGKTLFNTTGLRLVYKAGGWWLVVRCRAQQPGTARGCASCVGVHGMHQEQHCPCKAPLTAPSSMRAPLPSLSQFALQDQYLELSTHVSRSAYLYGAGERGSETVHMTVRRPLPFPTLAPCPAVLLRPGREPASVPQMGALIGRRAANWAV